MLLLGGQSSIQIVLIAVPSSLLFNFSGKHRAAVSAGCVQLLRPSQRCPKPSAQHGDLGAGTAGTWLKLMSLLPLTGSAHPQSILLG